jgi:hypothetical protein
MGIHFDNLAELFSTSEALKTWKCGDLTWRDIARRAALFELPEIDGSKQSLLNIHGGRQGYDEDEIAFLSTNFFLPFPDIIVEDQMGCVIMSDCEQQQRGLSGLRQVLTYRHQQMEGMDYQQVTISYIRPSIHGTGPTAVWNIENPPLNQQSIASVNGNDLTEIPFPFAIPVFREDVCTALDEVIYLNTPSRYILEERPVQPTPEERQAKWRRRILRSDERARYVLLTPGEIKRKYFPNEDPERGSRKSPHWRRAHYKHLTSDFYVNKKGSTVLIPATWIGEEQVQRGNRMYRVLLDR